VLYTRKLYKIEVKEMDFSKISGVSKDSDNKEVFAVYLK
jgi:hypothetical protein